MFDRVLNTLLALIRKSFDSNPLSVFPLFLEKVEIRYFLLKVKKNELKVTQIKGPSWFFVFISANIFVIWIQQWKYSLLLHCYIPEPMLVDQKEPIKWANCIAGTFKIRIARRPLSLLTCNLLIYFFQLARHIYTQNRYA